MQSKSLVMWIARTRVSHFLIDASHAQADWLARMLTRVKSEMDGGGIGRVSGAPGELRRA